MVSSLLRKHSDFDYSEQLRRFPVYPFYVEISPLYNTNPHTFDVLEGLSHDS